MAVDPYAAAGKKFEEDRAAATDDASAPISGAGGASAADAEGKLFATIGGLAVVIAVASFVVFVAACDECRTSCGEVALIDAGESELYKSEVARYSMVSAGGTKKSAAEIDELARASVSWKQRTTVYALLVSCISMVVALVYVVLDVKRGHDAERSKYLSIFMLVWWVPGTGILTFDHPFACTGNGYFAAWTAGLAAVAMVHEEYEQLRAHALVQGIKSHLSDRDSLLETAVLVASLVVTWEGIEPVYNDFADVFMFCLYFQKHKHRVLG